MRPVIKAIISPVILNREVAFISSP
jgi:hypothetical protein